MLVTSQKKGVRNMEEYHNDAYTMYPRKEKERNIPFPSFL